jgi:hypothetical protein
MTHLKEVQMPRSKQKKHRYSGALATPITWPSPPIFEGAVTEERVAKHWAEYDQHQTEAVAIVAQIIQEKLNLLMEHYSATDKESLILALALEHVPGFQIAQPGERKRGRRLEWDASKLESLLCAVQMVKQQHNFNDRTALTFLANDPSHAQTWGTPQRHKGGKKQWIETLESRLQDAKRVHRDAADALASLREIAQQVTAKFRE